MLLPFLCVLLFRLRGYLATRFASSHLGDLHPGQHFGLPGARRIHVHPQRLQVNFPSVFCFIVSFPFILLAGVK
jgi:hypothetical protein